MRKSILCAAIACSLTLAVFPAAAQNKETLARFAKDPHVGPVEQALVGITVTFRGKTGDAIEVRRGNGMMLRCDGFVLFPAFMLAHRRDEPDDIRPDIQVYLHLDENPVKCAAPWPVHIPQTVPLRMVKVPNVHAPALRTLLPDSLQPGDALTVAWRQWDADKSAFGPLRKKTVHYVGRSPETKKLAIYQLQEPVEDVPPGAVVLGPEGLAIGMMPEAGSHTTTEFVSTEALRNVTNCVIPVPTPDGIFAASQSAAPAQNEPPDAVSSDPKNDQAGGKPGASGMVRIAGGPVAVLRSVLNQQDEMQGATIACLPPFEIDRTEVTNRQYWEWWSKLPDKKSADIALRARYWPLGWAAEGAPFAAEIKDVPVLGVPFTGAQAYAYAQGKRLPTPYEWCLAALGPAGEGQAPAWMAQYVEDRKAAALRIKEAHLQFLRDHIADVDAETFLNHGPQINAQTNQFVPFRDSRGIARRAQPNPRIGSALFWPYLPWLIAPERDFMAAPLTSAPQTLYRLNDRLAMQAFSKRAVEVEADAIWSRYKAPMHVLPAGARDFDISLNGVSDMLFNAHDYVVAPPFSQHGDEGYTLYVNWVGMSSKPLAGDALVLLGPVKSEAFWPSSRVIQVPRSPRLARWMQIGMNLHEAQSLFYLIAGWSFEMGPEPLHELHEVKDAFPWSAMPPVVQDDFPVWLHEVWSGKSGRTVSEIGSVADIERLAAMPADTGTLAYGFLNMDVLRPVGFRCAR